MSENGLTPPWRQCLVHERDHVERWRLQLKVEILCSHREEDTIKFTLRLNLNVFDADAVSCAARLYILNVEVERVLLRDFGLAQWEAIYVCHAWMAILE